MSESTPSNARGGGDRASPATDRVRVKRIPERGVYDRAVIDPILDEGLVAHVGVVDDGRPFVLPMAYARDGDAILLHGARRSRTVEALASGAPVCVTVTLLDGLVLARSAFHHSMNYRSVVVLGRGAPIVAEEERLAAFGRFTDRIVGGRAALVRAPDEKESRATTIVRVAIEEASAKTRSGGPLDDETDLAWPVWAGVIPLALVSGTPIEDLPDGVRGEPRPGRPDRWRPEGRC